MAKKVTQKPVKPRKPNTIFDNEARVMVRNVYKYLKEEYEFTMLHRDCPCQFNHLRNIGRRTAQAVGVSPRTLHRIVREEWAQLGDTTTPQTSGTSVGTTFTEGIILPSPAVLSTISCNTIPSQLGDGDTIIIEDDNTLDNSTLAISSSTNNTSTRDTSSTTNVQKNNLLFIEINENGQISKIFRQ